jgi:hypothetical protein
MQELFGPILILAMTCARARIALPSQLEKKMEKYFFLISFLSVPSLIAPRIEASASIIASSSFTIGSKASIKDSLGVIKKLSFQDSICD